MLIDTHAHLWFPEYKDDLDEVIARAKATGVEKMIVPGTSRETSRQATELAKKYPGVIYGAVGVHPEEVDGLDLRFMIRDLRKLITENRGQVVAIGEIGIDIYTEELRAKLKEQQEMFRVQCELAVEMDLPIIVHTRQSLGETLAVLDKLPKMPRGQFHCFSHDEIGLKEVLARGFYVSFGGNITWSKRVKKMVPLVPVDKLLLETDSPLMMPRNTGGETIEPTLRNEPKNVRMLATLQAELRGVPGEQLASETNANARRLYRL
ncbi:MAG: TatD family hydrolase [bacterium]